MTNHLGRHELFLVEETEAAIIGSGLGALGLGSDFWGAGDVEISPANPAWGLEDTVPLYIKMGDSSQVELMLEGFQPGFPSRHGGTPKWSKMDGCLIHKIHEKILSGWCFGTMDFYDFPFSWECHDPNWRTNRFFRGVGLNHQDNYGTSPFFMGKLTISMAIFQFANCKRLPEGISH